MESDQGKSSRNCPTCREPFGQTPIRNLFAETFIGDLTGQCEGCSVSMLRKELVAHRQRCDEVRVECPFRFAGCAIRPRQTDLGAHMCTNGSEHLALLAIAPAAALASAAAPLVALLRGAAIEPVQVAAANTLRDLADDEDTMHAIVRAGAIPLLVSLLGEDGTAPCATQRVTERLKEAVLGTLLKLAQYDMNRSRIVHDGFLVKHAIALLSGHSDGVNKAALDVLLFLGVGYVAWEMESAITPLVALLHDGTDCTKEAAMKLLNNLCFENPFIQVASKVAIAPLVAILNGSAAYPLKGLAACALRNIATQSKNSVIIEREGGIAPLVALLDVGATGGCNVAAAGALFNLAINTDLRVVIARAGAIPLLVTLRSEGGTNAVKEMATNALTRLGINCKKRGIAQAGGCVTRARSVRQQRT